MSYNYSRFHSRHLDFWYQSNEICVGCYSNVLAAHENIGVAVEISFLSDILAEL